MWRFRWRIISTIIAAKVGDSGKAAAVDKHLPLLEQPECPKDSTATPNLSKRSICQEVLNSDGKKDYRAFVVAPQRH